MKSTRVLILSLLTILTLLLSACGGAAEDGGNDGGEAPASQPTETSSESSSDGDQPASGGEWTIDPANAAGDNARAAVSYVYEGLMRMEGGEVVGALAESYTVSEDGLDYIFNLRPGVTFHDGTPLTADIVVVNFNRWFDSNDANRGSGEYAAWLANFGGFKGEVTEEGAPKSIYDGIEKVNDLTVLIHLNTEDPDFIKKITDPAFSIASPASFAGGDGGSGPYQFAGLSGSNALLEPFDGYWDASAIPAAGMEVPVE